MAGTGKLVRVRPVLLWATLLLILLLIYLSVAGAFVGTERARELFNSVPLVIFWISLTVLLLVGLVVFPRLYRKPGLLLIHLGCVLLLVGAMAGSEKGHEYFGKNKIPKGYMWIFEGESDNRIRSNNPKVMLGELPFWIRLNDFRMEYYWDWGKLLIQTMDGKHKTIVARAGEKFDLGGKWPEIKINRVIKHFNLETFAEDLTGPTNPVLDIDLVWPDGTVNRKYVFERFPEFGMIQGGLKLTYMLMVKDYFSDLEVIEGGKYARKGNHESLEVIKKGKAVKRKVIEVNKPLYYGGYYFYQSSYDNKRARYTVLSVSSDTGYPLVFGGYLLICLGLVWQFWLRYLLKQKEKRKINIENGD